MNSKRTLAGDGRDRTRQAWQDPVALGARIASELARRQSAPTAELREFRKQVSRELKEADAHAVLDVAYELLRPNDFIYRFIAYELIHHHHTALKSLRSTDLKRLGKGMDSWAAVDTFASYLSGPAWREKQISDAVVNSWARSRDLWWRRAALVSTVPLNNKARGGKGNTKRTVAVCRLLVNDRHDMVIKAMSWALRELAKRDPAGVQVFLAVYRKKLAARIVREVENKLATGLKYRRR